MFISNPSLKYRKFVSFSDSYNSRYPIGERVYKKKVCVTVCPTVTNHLDFVIFYKSHGLCDISQILKTLRPNFEQFVVCLSYSHNSHGRCDISQILETKF